MAFSLQPVDPVLQFLNLLLLRCQGFRLGCDSLTLFSQLGVPASKRTGSDTNRPCSFCHTVPLIHHQSGGFTLELG
jgi:hypothetical protein